MAPSNLNRKREVCCLIMESFICISYSNSSSEINAGALMGLTRNSLKEKSFLILSLKVKDGFILFNLLVRS